MRKRILLTAAAVACGLAIVAGIMATAKRSAEAPPITTAPASEPAPARLAPSDRQLRKAQAAVEQFPGRAAGYNDLCAAWLKKARETGDFALHAKAEEALDKSLALAPDNYDALKLKAALLLSYHRFTEALEVARRAQKLRPGDYENYGAMTDALVELGEYDAAVEAAQVMVDLRPNAASYSRVSYLRALHGDTRGAIEAMRVAAEAADPQDVEAIAWYRVHLGDELLNAGKLKEAEREYDYALHASPDDHRALSAKARARLAANDTAGAVAFYERAQARLPAPETVIALGDLYASGGRDEDARRQYALVDFIERSNSAGGTYSRSLAVFWADHDTRLDEALLAAEKERAARRDIYTCDALAWCLFKKNRFIEAEAAMNEALRLGTRDARLFYHAGMIARSRGRSRDAAKYFKLALQINPAFDVRQAESAREELSALGGARNLIAGTGQK